MMGRFYPVCGVGRKAAGSAFTASVAFAPATPVAASVSVALVPPAVAVAEAMERAASAIPSVTSSKLAAVTPLA